MSEKQKEVEVVEPESKVKTPLDLRTVLRGLVGKKTTVEMPGGVVTPAGILFLTDYLRELTLKGGSPVMPINRATFRTMAEETGMEWCNKQGTWPKRFIKKAKAIWKEWEANGYLRDPNATYKDFYTQPVISEIGSLISRNTEHDTKFIFDLTNSFDWHAGDFGDSGSCFWDGRSAVRGFMEEAGYLALRFYDPNRPPRIGSGLARCWIGWDPKTGNPVLFNGYGYELIRQVRIFATYLGVLYHKVDINNFGDTGGMLYLNGGQGFILGLTEHPNRTIDFKLETREHKECSCCGDNYPEEEMSGLLNGEYVCPDCFAESYKHCGYCGTTYHRDESHRTYLKDGHMDVCPSCWERYGWSCDDCHKDFLTSKTRCKETKGKMRCPDCHAKWMKENTFECKACHCVKDNSERMDAEGKTLCKGCHQLHVELFKTGIPLEAWHNPNGVSWDTLQEGAVVGQTYRLLLLGEPMPAGYNFFSINPPRWERGRQEGKITGLFNSSTTMRTTRPLPENCKDIIKEWKESLL